MTDRICTTQTQHAAPSLRRPPLAVLIGVSLVSILVTLTLVEIALRIYIDNLTPERRQPTGTALLKDIPGSERIYGLTPRLPPPTRINSFGFRGPEIALTKPSGVFRILMLGDSITYGNAVDWDQTFSYQLQQLLNDQGSSMRFEVLNLGVSGYNSRQELASLRELGMQFAPDLVVLNVCLNDSDPPKHLYGIALKNETSIKGWSDLNFRT